MRRDRSGGYYEHKGESYLAAAVGRAIKNFKDHKEGFPMSRKDNQNHKAVKTDSRVQTVNNQIPPDDPERDFYPDISSTVSAGECTGMMYAPPQDEEAFDAYQDLSGMEIPKAKDKTE